MDGFHSGCQLRQASDLEGFIGHLPAMFIRLFLLRETAVESIIDYVFNEHNCSRFGRR